MKSNQLYSGVLLVLFSSAGINSYAASAVAANKSTGSYGYAYGKKSEAEAKKAAIENCPGGGEIISSSSEDGYGAVLRTVNNWKTEGQTIVVKGILAQQDPVGIRKPGTGECPDCMLLDVWFDNAATTDKEKFEGAGSRRAPEVLKTDGSNRRDGEFRDLKIIDGRELRHGYGIQYTSPETKTVMKEKTEYYMGLPDGMKYNYDYVEGQDIKIKYYRCYKDGWSTYSINYGATGEVEEYKELTKGVPDGALYDYDFKGVIEKKTRYKNGKQHGDTYEYAKGVLVKSGRYEFGKREGEWISYAADGKTVKKKETFAQGLSISVTEFKTETKPKAKTK